MRKFQILLSIPMLICVSCGENKPPRKPVFDLNERSVFHLDENDELTIVNFADTHLADPDILDDDETFLTKTIKKAIQEAKPNLITFSGDNAWQAKTLECYKKLCDFMDQFGIPYYFAFGNHETEYKTANEIIEIINQSTYGYIEAGPENTHGRHNFVIDIKNEYDEIVHSLYIMDSGDYYDNDPDDIVYVDDCVPGVPYSTYAGFECYGSTSYDNIRDNQIDWYTEEVGKRNKESTIITHIPLMEFTFAYEEYQNAKLNLDDSKITQLSPIGKCRMLEPCCSSSTNFGFFDIVKNLGSTKNIIVGHDHKNDFSLLYEGIRLTFSLKTSENCYWVEDGTMSGYTKLKIDKNGKTTLTQNYLNPFRF